MEGFSAGEGHSHIFILSHGRSGSKEKNWRQLGSRGGGLLYYLHTPGRWPGVSESFWNQVDRTEVWRVRRWDWVILESSLMVWLPTGFRLVEGRG